MRRYLNEKILLFKIQRGDSQAFASIYDFYVNKIYRFVYLKVPTVQDAEDICAEVFLKTWQYIKDGKKVKDLQAFIYQVARNAVVDFYRRTGSNISLDEDDRQDIVVSDMVDISLEEKMMIKSDLVNIEKSLRKLKDGYREIIILHFLNELSLKEVSTIIGRSQGATRVMLHRGLKILRKLATNEPDSDEKKISN